ncbi:MAG: hypothetical protein JXR07_07665 [Reichenbachiella sp.]
MSTYSDLLKADLIDLSKNHSKRHNLSIKVERPTAIIFEKIASSFNTDSFLSIKSNKEWAIRLTKEHSQVKDTKEMQSSNSSDALLMNIFCHPKIRTWKGVCDVLGIKSILDIQFGINPTYLLKEGKPEGTPTEIDMVINDKIYCEAKLTEKDFTEVQKDKMEKYDSFRKVFDIDRLPMLGDKYLHYQLLRNILAIEADDKRFLLLCDARRPDLIHHLFDVVSCIKDIELRKRCSFICWQDIARKCGSDLKEFLVSKYGLD